MNAPLQTTLWCSNMTKQFQLRLVDVMCEGWLQGLLAQLPVVGEGLVRVKRCRNPVHFTGGSVNGMLRFCGDLAADSIPYTIMGTNTALHMRGFQ